MAGFRSILGAVREVCGELFASRTLLLACALFLPYVGVLLGMGAAAAYGYATGAQLPVQMLLWTEGGLAEWFEYAMTASVAVLLFILWLEARQPAYLANALLFVWLTLDNSLEFHETAGAFLTPMFSALTPDPEQAEGFGELLTMAIVGAIWGGGLLLSLRKSAMRALVQSLALAGCVVAAAGFGVLVDFADVLFKGSSLELASNFIEDGGELVCITLSLIVACTIFDTERAHRKRQLAQSESAPGSLKLVA